MRLEILAQYLIFDSRKLMEKEEKKNIDQEFVKQFLLNGTLVNPTEALMIETEPLDSLTEKLRNNRTFCFNTDPGEFGWCAVCKVTSFNEIVCKVVALKVIGTIHGEAPNCLHFI